MIRHSDSITALAAALTKAQANMTNAPKETKGQVGNQVRFYTDLPTLTDLVRPILAEQGLAYVQLPSDGGAGFVSLTTRLIHESGEWIEADYPMPAGSGAQGVGSAITYARRYALMALFGIAADDDDGHAASQQPTQPRNQPKAPAAARKPGAPTQAVTRRAMAMFVEAGITEREQRIEFTAYVCKRPITSWSEVDAAEAHDVIAVLDRLINGKVTLGFDDGHLAVRDVA